MHPLYVQTAFQQVIGAGEFLPDTTFSLRCSFAGRIIRASHCPPEAIRANHDMLHTHNFDTAELDKILTSSVRVLRPTYLHNSDSPPRSGKSRPRMQNCCSRPNRTTSSIRLMRRSICRQLTFRVQPCIQARLLACVKCLSSASSTSRASCCLCMALSTSYPQSYSGRLRSCAIPTACFSRPFWGQ